MGKQTVQCHLRCEIALTTVTVASDRSAGSEHIAATKAEPAHQ